MTNRKLAIQNLIDSLSEAYPQRGFKIHPALSFTNTSILGGKHEIGATLSQPVKAGDILLVIPSKEFVTTKHNDAEPIRKVLHMVLKRAKTVMERQEGHEVYHSDADVAISVLIMYAVANNSEGSTTIKPKFSNIVNTWPSPKEQSEVHPIYWSIEEGSPLRNVLQNTPVLHKMQILQKQIKGMFDSVVLKVLTEMNVMSQFVKPSYTTTSTEALWEAYLYAASISFSRCHGSEESPMIVPCVDLFNGLSERCDNKNINVALAKGKWPFIKGNMHSNECNLSCDAVYATRDISAGEELYISYGSMPNNDFLLKYGVIPRIMMQEVDPRTESIILRVPPEFGPDMNDHLRVKALRKHNYPTSPDEIRDNFMVDLTPEEYNMYVSPLQNLKNGECLQLPYVFR